MRLSGPLNLKTIFVLMEPATVIITALALGAATGVKTIAEQAVKDGYTGLKTLITSRYPGLNIEKIEQQPNSEAQRKAAEEGLVDAGGDRDREILQKAKLLLEAIENLSEEELPSIGINLEKVKGASLLIDDVSATGRGVNIKESEFGDITIKKVTSRRSDDNSPKS